MIRLSVNINKVALIRNSRGSNLPNLEQFVKDCEEFGAQGITVHPRPDERHIRYDDVPRLQEIVTTELNVEGYPSKRFLDMVCEVKPAQCTLVPDPPDVLTSDTGWDMITEAVFLKDVVAQLHEADIRVALFCNAEVKWAAPAAATGADRIELYTGDYAVRWQEEDTLGAHVEIARVAEQLNLGLNAGHDLNLDNLSHYARNVPGLLEVSIGHALVSDSLYYGIHNTIQMYLQKLAGA